MQQIPEGIDPEIWSQIQETFDKIKEDAGIEPDEEYMSELEELLGMSVDEMNEGHMKMIKTRTVGVELVHDDAKFPTYAYPSDSGFDLWSVEEVNFLPFERKLVSTGLSFDIPEGHEIQVRTKSGLAIKQGLMVLNSPGTVDQGYTGEVKVILMNMNNMAMTVDKGQKIAQAVLCSVESGKKIYLHHVEEFNEKERGDNGFGSTGI